MHHRHVHVVAVQFQSRFDRRVRRADDDYFGKRVLERFIVIMRHLRAVFAGNTQVAGPVEIASGQDHFVGAEGLVFGRRHHKHVALFLHALHFSKDLSVELVVGRHFAVILKGLVAVGFYARHRERDAPNLDVFGSGKKAHHLRIPPNRFRDTAFFEKNMT